MPMDFDDDDISGVIDETEEESQAPVRPQVQQTSAQDLDDQMSEVEKRLEMAQYYRLVLQDTIFNDPPNVEVADRVEGEIREFVRSRMALLVGVGAAEKKPEPVVSQFTDAEVLAIRTLAQPEVVSALKALAAKVLKKPEILDAKPLQAPAKPKAPAREPTLKKIVRPAPSVEAETTRTVRSPAQAAPRGRGKKQEKVFKTVTTEDGREVKMDITPQAQPVGVKPFPTPVGKAAIENFSAQTARQQAMVAVANLDRQFSGK